MKIARLLITLNCNRNCDGCCNKHDIFKPKILPSLETLSSYDEVLITGGEPLMRPLKIIEVVDYLHHNFTKPKIYLYSAFFDYALYESFFHKIDGLHYTLHYPANDDDISMLHRLSNKFLSRNGYNLKSLRLSIDKRCYDQYDFSNIDFHNWKVVRKMEWKINCPLPNHETLYKLKDV